MRHNCSWHHQSIPERMLTTKDTLYLELVFFWQNWPLGKELPMPQPLTKCLMSVQDKQDTRKRGCQTLSRKGKTVLKFFLPLKMALTKVGCFNIANKTLGDCPGSQLSLSFVPHFGSCLIVLSVSSSKIIFLLGASMGLKTR